MLNLLVNRAYRDTAAPLLHISVSDHILSRSNARPFTRPIYDTSKIDITAQLLLRQKVSNFVEFTLLGLLCSPAGFKHLDVSCENPVLDGRSAFMTRFPKGWLCEVLVHTCKVVVMSAVDL